MPPRSGRTGERAEREQAARKAQADLELQRLGEALKERSTDVVEDVVRRTQAAGEDVDEGILRSLESVGNAATAAVALWMSGGKPDAGRDTANETFETFGQLAAHRAAPLDELTKRCLRWRDAVSGVLRDSATHLDVSAEALAKALAMTQMTLDATLVSMCAVFETARRHTDEELERRQEELAFMATHDQLTGLPNRTLIVDRAEQMFARSRRRRSPVAALFINLDNFTSITDTFGHAVGDELLQAIAARLDGVVRDADALGRLGRDEFVVLAEEISLAAGPELIADRLLEALKAPFTVGGASELTVTASIGIASGERNCAEDLLRDADIAMHQAKWGGRDRYVMFESGMQDLVQTRMELEMNLRGALDRDEFFLVYQPTFALRDMNPTGVEALLRWERPGRGTVQPNDFIPLLEETGLIIPVGKWVLDQATRQCAAWRADGHEIGVAVNVSGRQLDSDEFVIDVKDALTASGLSPKALTLEITETTLMRNTEETATRLRAAKDLGVKIAIDDFGTGYSSLAHIQRFPIDSLKIDRSFISQLADNPEGETLIRTLVQLGKALSIETLAEGIEREHELSLLQAEQCDSGQGYLYARPLTADAAEEFLNNWRSGAAVTTPSATAAPVASAAPVATAAPIA
jgi:diguanylate cyclase (GGDEF)-like protein